MFYGIIIRMYFAPSEHPPPHFHVYYGEYKATVDIRTCEVIQGNLPKKTNKACFGAVRATSGWIDGRLGISDEWRRSIQDSAASI